ncbi:MAG: four helix bundle protein [Terriglobales bacterium]
MQGHRDLLVWQKAMRFVTDVYQMTKAFPREEIYGLTSQLRRAAVSVPSNIAEGHGRGSRNEFHQFIGHARASLLEVETQIEIAFNLGHIDAAMFSRMVRQSSEIGRMLTGLRSWAAGANS